MNYFNLRTMKETTTGDIKEVYVGKCPKCGNIQYVIGRELTTGDIMCKCHEKKTVTDIK